MSDKQSFSEIKFVIERLENGAYYVASGFNDYGRSSSRAAFKSHSEAVAWATSKLCEAMDAVRV